jgi:hypothetical protein
MTFEVDNSIQFNSTTAAATTTTNNNNNSIHVLFTCKLNSTEANYKVSTVTWIYTKITKEQDTKHDSL